MHSHCAVALRTRLRTSDGTLTHATLAVCVSLAAAIASAAPRRRRRRSISVGGQRGRRAADVSDGIAARAHARLLPAQCRRSSRRSPQSKVLIEEVDLDELTNPATAHVAARQGDAHRRAHARSGDRRRPLQDRCSRAREKAGLPAMARAADEAVDGGGVADGAGAEGGGLQRGARRRQALLRQGAQPRGMERRALETVAYQFDRLDQMSPAMQEAMLRSVIADLDTQLVNVKTIADAWARGETATHREAAARRAPSNRRSSTSGCSSSATATGSSRSRPAQAEDGLLRRRRRRAPGRARQPGRAAAEEGLYRRAAVD